VSEATEFHVTLTTCSQDPQWIVFTEVR